MKPRRSDWGQTPSSVANYMTSGKFKNDGIEKRRISSITKLFHLIRKLDKHMGTESRVFYDKLAFQALIRKHDIKTPITHATLRREQEWDKFWNVAGSLDTFVLKPNRLSEGRGIHVLTKTDDPNVWKELNGENVSLETLKKDSIGFLRRKTVAHKERKVHNIMIAEERIYSHDDFKNYTLYDGIVDFRLYLLDDKVLYGKMRCPTEQSKGLGNTAKQAIALFVIDGYIRDGRDTFSNTTTKYNGISMVGKEVPFWDKIITGAEKVAEVFKSPFHSVDLTVDGSGEVVVMESEKIPTLGHFRKEEATRLHEILTEWANEKLWKVK